MATERDDIILDENGEDLIKDGDFAVDNGIEDDGVIIINSAIGSIKTDALLGMNIAKFMNKKITNTELQQDIASALKRDSITSKNIEIKNGNISVEL